MSLAGFGQISLGLSWGLRHGGGVAGAVTERICSARVTRRIIMHEELGIGIVDFDV